MQQLQTHCIYNIAATYILSNAKNYSVKYRSSQQMNMKGIMNTMWLTSNKQKRKHVLNNGRM